jgi:hypothetical protein
LTNGELVTVKAVRPNGQIELQDGRVLPENYREFVRGYAITSYGSQGKTVQHVLFSDSTVKAATNNQQWLVTISRGTRAVKIFTQDKAQLRENVGRLGDRELAIEFAKQDSPQLRRVPPPVRKYINGLIQSRRPQVAQLPIEKIDLWKSNLTQNDATDASAKNLTCWRTATSPQCLRVEMTGEIHFFPYGISARKIHPARGQRYC